MCGEQYNKLKAVYNKLACRLSQDITHGQGCGKIHYRRP